MFPEKLRFVYRCALVVDLLLSVAFLVLSGVALGQKETFFRKMVEFGAIPYFVFATTLPCIAIWMAPQKREHSICGALRYGDSPFAWIPVVLVLITIGPVLSLLIVSLIQSEPYSPLAIVLAISTFHLVITVPVLVIGKMIGDDEWRSPVQYTALDDNVPVVHDTADTA
jgi:predicted permease